MSKKKNDMHYHAPEVLAFFLLRAYDELSEDAQIEDKPDIVDRDLTVEVTAALGDTTYARDLFGETPRNKINAEAYVCKDCPNYSSCVEQSSLDPLVICTNEAYLMQRKKPHLITDEHISASSAVLYSNSNCPHPRMLPHSIAVVDDSSLIKQAIEEKERKAAAYIKKSINNLFIFCASWPKSFSEITSNTFDNIYLFRPGSEALYKNAMPLTSSETVQHALYMQVQQQLMQWVKNNKGQDPSPQTVLYNNEKNKERKFS